MYVDVALVSSSLQIDTKPDVVSDVGATYNYTELLEIDSWL